MALEDLHELPATTVVPALGAAPPCCWTSRPSSTGRTSRCCRSRPARPWPWRRSAASAPRLAGKPGPGAAAPVSCERNHLCWTPCLSAWCLSRVGGNRGIYGIHGVHGYYRVVAASMTVNDCGGSVSDSSGPAGFSDPSVTHAPSTSGRTRASGPRSAVTVVISATPSNERSRRMMSAGSASRPRLTSVSAIRPRLGRGRGRRVDQGERAQVARPGAASGRAARAGRAVHGRAAHVDVDRDVQRGLGVQQDGVVDRLGGDGAAGWSRSARWR